MINENGRHPLQELVVERFIPNSAVMTPESPSVVILTGPNSSGKSVLLKQIGTQIHSISLSHHHLHESDRMLRSGR